MTISQAKEFFQAETGSVAERVIIQHEPRSAAIIKSKKAQITFEGIDGSLRPIRMKGNGIEKKYSNITNRLYR